MTVAVDTISLAGDNGDNTTVVTVGTQANRTMYAAFIGILGNMPSAGNVTWGSQALTKILEEAEGTARPIVQWWRLIAPDSGTQNFDQNGSFSPFVVFSLYNVDQTTPELQTAQSGSLSVSTLACNLSSALASGSMTLTVGADLDALGGGSTPSLTAESTDDTISQDPPGALDAIWAHGAAQNQTYNVGSGLAAIVAVARIEVAAAVGLAHVKTVDSIALAHVKTVNGIAIAHVKSIDSIT